MLVALGMVKTSAGLGMAAQAIDSANLGSATDSEGVIELRGFFATMALDAVTGAEAGLRGGILVSLADIGPMADAGGKEKAGDEEKAKDGKHHDEEVAGVPLSCGWKRSGLRVFSISQDFLEKTLLFPFCWRGAGIIHTWKS